MLKRHIHSTVGWRKYLDPNENSRASVFLKKNGTRVFTELISNIEHAIDENKEEVIILVHPNVTSVVSIGRGEYVVILNHCLEWFKKKEEYEYCAKIVKIRDKIKKSIVSSAVVLN